MYLKALEIQGFKSFPDKTVLTFEKNITAIVGPNGSGKSNISDAVLWVMGEQRTKALRGAKMEDVIFGGTQKRSPLGFAQVSLILDNSARIFDCDKDEIILSRRYYRSGDSEYYINRESVRLKDITTLLMDTGLGRDGYSIIGQGKIAEIVSTKSTDRREVFEEAAGISKFRYRKEEAERKLEHTDENLTRINDKIDELELQVVPLRKQSEVAKKYLVLRDELKVREISAWMTALDQLKQRSELIRSEYEQTENALETAKSGLEALYISSNSISDRMHQKDIEAENVRSIAEKKEAEKAELESEAAVLRTKISNEISGREKLKEDIQGQESRANEIKSGIVSANERISVLCEKISEYSESKTKNNNIIDGGRLKLASRETNVSSISEKVSTLNVELRSLSANISMLERLEKEYEGYSKAVKTVMREAEHGVLKGVFGPAGNLLKTEKEYALAIETALGSAAQNIIIDSQNNGRIAIELLKKRDAGRATFLPLDTIQGTVMKEPPLTDPGYVGIAYELIETDKRYLQIFANLLGRTVVAEDLTSAVRISRANGNRLRIVTLDGQLINTGGSMTGGSISRGTGILSRANELKELKIKLEKISAESSKYEERLSKAKSDLASVRYQLDVAVEEHGKITALLSASESEKRATENSVQQLSLLLDSISGDSEQRKAAIENIDKRIDHYKAELSDKEHFIENKLAELRSIKSELEKIVSEKLELEAKRTKAEKESQKHNADVIDLERSLARIEQRKISAELEEKQITDKLWDNYEIGRTAANDIRQPVDNLQKAYRDIAQLRREMSALGNPNLGAIEEFERVNTRYTFLKEQRDDINHAKSELQKIIDEITKEMETVFVSKFEEIDKCFRQTFLELFGGGKAALVLEDSNDVLNCGIEIKAQPPGKALTNISLMSGGEKAFVAIALYFAILKVRPTPFCIMDEIEAALDEANVSRYAEYMRRMSENTQFLVITHRRGTMEEADVLYGVTMQEKGVSTVISIDLEEAEKAAG